MSWHRKARAVGKRTGAGFHGVELLEDRRLLTRIVGGESFEFFDPLDSATAPATRRIIRVEAVGNVSAELLGAVVSPANQITITNIPGDLTSPIFGRGGPVLGGLGGGNGYQLIGPTPITDPINGVNGTFTVVPSDSVNLTAMASDAFGNTYAFNIVPIAVPVAGGTPVAHALVQLVRVNTSTGDGTVVASLELQLPTDPANDALILPAGDNIGTSTITSILGADFGPDGLLYFVAVDDTPATGFPTPRLYTVDVNAVDPLNPQQHTYPVTPTLGTFQTVDAASFADVQSIAFNNAGQLIAYYVQGGNGQLATVDILNTDNLSNPVNVDIAGTTTNLDNITGIEAVPGDPLIYAVTRNDGDIGEIYSIDRATGDAVLLGDIPDTLPADADWSLQSLTYDSQLVDPFTGQLGALISTETVNDILVYINRTPRLGQYLYSIDVSESDATAQIIVSVINRQTGAMAPFTRDTNIGGNALAVVNAVTGSAPPVNGVRVAANANSGGVFLGQRTVDIAATTTVNESLIPFLSAPLNGSLGTVAPIGGVVNAGFFVRENLLGYVGGTRDSSLLGSNFSLVNDLAARNDGTIAAINLGAVPNELGLIDPGATAVNPASIVGITLTGVGTPLAGVEAIAWLDQTLYAVIPMGNGHMLGTVDVAGVFTPIAPIANVLGAVTALAFAPDARLFVVDSSSTLQEIDPVTGLALNLPLTISDGLAPILVSGMAFDAAGALFGIDGGNGRLVDIDLTTGLAGFLTATPNGSFRASAQALTFDPVRGQFLTVDNLSGAVSLMFLAGTESTSAVPQDFGKFLFDGVVTGQVDVSGSMDMFYAGWIVTGGTTGESYSTPGVPGNFHVGGELRNMFSFDSVGTNSGAALNQSTYTSGFDMVVGGKLGQAVTREDFIGSVSVLNNGMSLPAGTVQTEIEMKDNANSVGANFAAGLLQNARFFNDTFGTPQYLGTINSTDPVVGDNAVQVTGQIDDLNGDDMDYYGVALMAGQTIVVQLLNSPGLSVGVFDPDGREIDTDYSNLDSTQTMGQRFQVTADRPGVYRFAIGYSDDPDFDGGEFATGSSGLLPYTLTVSGIGDVALGGLVATGNIYDGRSTGTAWHVQQGDLGAIVAVGEISSTTIPTFLTEDATPAVPEDALIGATVEVTNGDLRTVQGASIGQTRLLGIDLDVFNGSVGLINAVSGDLTLNASLESPPRVSDHDPVGVSRLVATKGDYQVVNTGGIFRGAILTNMALGMLRTGGDLLGGLLLVNADKTGKDGKIDLLDVGGDVVRTAIITGPGGDVRYMHVGGTAFRDSYFGSGSPEETVFRPGESAVLRDDSGALVTISPGRSSSNATLTVLTYGIRGSGGSAILNVNSTGDVIVRNGSKNQASVAEIGRITTGGTFVELDGQTKVDVYEITGGAMDFVVNNTHGEFVNLTASSANRIEADNIGVPMQSTAAAVNGMAVRANAFPFASQRTLISVPGTIGLLKARQAIGNVSAGTITQLIADSDRKRNPAVYEGIVGPVTVTGNLPDVTIGQGIMPSGTGNMAAAGLFAAGFIGNVRGDHADIRGDIVSNTRIDLIQLRNESSIINADIMMVDSFDQSREFIGGWSGVGDNDPVNNTIISEIGNIYVDGAVSRARQAPPHNGGIIGLLAVAPDIGTVRVRNGFGLIESQFWLPADGTMEGVEVSGYGIRDTSFNGGAVFKRIMTTGAGSATPTTNFSSQLRASETMEFDSFSHFEPNRLTDLHVYLGTTAAVPTNTGVTEAGRLAGVNLTASRDVTLIKGWQVGTSNQTGGAVTSNFNVANKIATFQTISDINDIEITTGEIGKFLIGGNVISLDMTYAGLFSKLQVTGNFDVDSSIKGVGPDSEIKTLFINGDMAGLITALLDIGKATVRGNFTGQILVNGVPIVPL